MRLDAMAVRIPPVKGHPNRVAFEGVLTVVNAPSDKAPAGARGHRGMLTREAAEAMGDGRRTQTVTWQQMDAALRDVTAALHAAPDADLDALAAQAGTAPKHGEWSGAGAADPVIY